MSSLNFRFPKPQAQWCPELLFFCLYRSQFQAPDVVNIKKKQSKLTSSSHPLIHTSPPLLQVTELASQLAQAHRDGHPGYVPGDWLAWSYGFKMKGGRRKKTPPQTHEIVRNPYEWVWHKETWEDRKYLAIHSESWPGSKDDPRDKMPR